VADGRTHRIVGGVAGGVAAAIAAGDRSPAEILVEALGGIAGGILGAMLPDELEPAIHSWHRSIMHSCSAAYVGAATLPALVAEWQAHCRNQATHHDRAASSASVQSDRIWHLGCALLWRLLSGLLLGLVVGYASHLVLDAATPRSLPLLF